MQIYYGFTISEFIGLVVGGITLVVLLVYYGIGAIIHAWKSRRTPIRQQLGGSRMDEILATVEKAQKSLRSTQENWREACLFDADEYLSEAVRLIKAAQKNKSSTANASQER